MNDAREKILGFIRINGPVLPVQVAKYINSNILFASAILSEMVSSRMVFLTHAKIGGSPLYYLKGQEHQFQKLYQYLGEKPKKAYDLIKEKRVLRDRDCEPWQRVALREIDDFAKMITVNLNGQVEVFWKWHLFSDEEAKNVIEGIINGFDKKVEEEVKEEIVVAQVAQKKEIKEVKERKQKVMKEFDSGKLDDYFSKNKIIVLDKEVIKKNKEIDFLLEISSSVGKINFYAKFLDKGKVNEGDLSLAYHKGQNRKLPVMVLSTGELTKSAKSYLEKELKGLVFRKV